MNTDSKPAATPVALTIAGSDPSAGAGIQADLKTFTALGVYGCTVITALTAQNTQQVEGVWPVEGNHVAAQLNSLIDDINVGAVKTGMLGDRYAVAAVADFLDQNPSLPYVCDPVIISSSGKRLLDTAGAVLLKQRLLPRVTLLTPNLSEAAQLADQQIAKTEDAMITQAERLLEMGAKAVLLTGGHLGGDKSSDAFLWRDGDKQICEMLRTQRIVTKNTHGTGCTLSAAITAGLAKGLTLSDAVYAAKEYVTHALAHADQLNIGNGAGPLQHFYQ